ncbi:enolase-phosphatase E1, partial [Spiromyces aspiralis]
MPSQGLPSNYQVVLLDIEGTTTPISFVHDVMFPYVSNNICEFLDKKRDDPNIKPYIADLAKQSKEDAANGVEGVVVIDQDASQEEDVKRRVIKNVLWQMGIDRKIAPLKNFQGLMWKDGFANGELKGL